MYGETGVMRSRAQQLREQAADVRTTAIRLLAQTEDLDWTGRAADTLRERVRNQAAHLRDVATHHETAAESLDRHLREVDGLKDAIAQRERRAQALLSDARIAASDAQDLPGDRRTRDFTPPPSGHRDWLTAELPGL